MTTNNRGLVSASRDELMAIWLFDDAPTVDAVPVVRCENCRKRHTWECAMHYESEDGNEQYGWENDNDFCSWGERKGGDGNG